MLMYNMDDIIDNTRIAVDNGFKAITLGRRILRTETAGMTVLPWLVYMCEQS